MDILKALEESIVAVYDKNGKKITFKSAKIKYCDEETRGVRNKYPFLYLDDCFCSSRGKYVEYYCPNCGELNKILLKRFLTKTTIECSKCKEKNENKIRKHKEFFLTGKKDEKRVKEEHNFYDEPEKFRQDYFGLHLTENEFYEIAKNIISIDGVVTNGCKNVAYIEAYAVDNQYRYVPRVILSGEVHPFNNVMIECPNCGTIYTISDSRSKRTKLLGNLLCRKCCFYNLDFPITSYETKFGDKITYQGSVELRFIRLCEDNNIRIMNGPIIDYYWNERERKYYVDFELPEYREIIEIKENHAWHREQVETGKWGAKEKAAEQFAKDNNKNFYLLFGSDLTGFIEKHINYD